MESIFQFVQLEKSEKLQDFTQQKLDKLETKYDYVIRADVFFKKEEAEANKGFICNIRLSAPGPRVFAESNEESFEAAVAETIRDLDRQLGKRKGQLKTY